MGSRNILWRVSELSPTSADADTAAGHFLGHDVGTRRQVMPPMLDWFWADWELSQGGNADPGSRQGTRPAKHPAPLQNRFLPSPSGFMRTSRKLHRNTFGIGYKRTMLLHPGKP